MTLENCEFAKEFHYFITIQMDGEGEKVRIDNNIQLIVASNRHFCSGDQPDFLSEPILPTNVVYDSDVRKPAFAIRMLCGN